MRAVRPQRSSTESKESGSQLGIRPLGERMEKAREYYEVRDPETERSGGRSANGSRPVGEQGEDHGLGHHGGPDPDPEVIILEEEERAE